MGEQESVSKDSTLTIGQVAWLKVVDVNHLGAFVDWGYSKDLFIPFDEQQHPLRPGSFTLVKIYLDNQGRAAGSTRIDHWIEDTATGLSIGQAVTLLIAEQTDLGFKAIIDHQFWGLLYSNELYRRVRKGQIVTGYIQRIRDDGKIDLTLNQPGFSESKIEALAR